MGLMARCLLLKAATVKTAEESAGPAVIVTAASGDEVYTAEVWGVHGVYSVPPDGTMGVRLPTDPAERFAPIVATHNYKTPRPTLAKGEVAIGSSNADGSSLMASARFYADGKMALGNSTKDILTLTIGLIDLIKGIVTTGTAATQTVNPATQAALEAYKAQYQALFKIPV